MNLDASLSFDELTTEQKRGPVTLFSPDTHTESNSPPFTFNGIELSEVPLSSKVPVVFHLDVDLNKSNLGKAVNERWPEIQAQILIEQQKRPDARFVKNERKKLLPHLETELRQLGVYRILACCGDDLPWYQIIEIYGNDLTQDKYSSDKLFRKEVQKKSKHLYPDLQNFQKLPLREI